MAPETRPSQLEDFERLNDRHIEETAEKMPGGTDRPGGAISQPEPVKPEKAADRG